MDYVKPNEITKAMVASGAAKADLPLRDLLLRGSLSGALLAAAASVALTATMQTNAPIVGALIFPVGFVIIVLLGLELVTGSFAVVPLAAVSGRRSWGQVAANLWWVFWANLLGSLAYGVLLYVVLTSLGREAASGLALKLVAAAEAKTNAYAAHGAAGLITVFVKAILCNWLVCLGVVMAMTSRSTVGKIAAAWLPIVMFFGMGFEHSVVNMFVIPTGILLGAKVSLSGWWLWNQLPVTLGNLVGGMLFTGLFLYWTYPPQEAGAPAAALEAEPAGEPARA